MEIIELLLQKGLVTSEQIEKAREEAKRTGSKLERALEKLGFIDGEDIAQVHAEVIGATYMNLSDYVIDAGLLSLIPEKLIQKYKVVPLFKVQDVLTVAMINPHDVEALDEIRRSSGIEIIDSVLASEENIQKILDSHYGVVKTVDEIVKAIDKEHPLYSKGGLSEVAEEPPVIRLANILIMEAVKERASDIHVEPEHDLVRIRYRIDGILHEVHTLPKKLQSALISRIKILANMDIAETRRAQDGKIRFKLDTKEVDIRVSTFPVVYGENVVMRLLDRTSVVFGLGDLGFSQENLGAFERLIQQPNGIILVTGPTGSGKTTTLYAGLSSISSMEKNIITIEDPVEYELPLIRQTQVNPKAGITFSNGLRSILRQDPDVIMVGEIRDKETADIAIQASLTGHLVFSTLHTNDAPSALTRLIDMGVEPFLISSSVIGVLAQRLVRTICVKCKERHTPAKLLLEDLGLDTQGEFYKGSGCSKCKNTGFMGRIGIFELLLINDEMKKLIEAKSSSDQIKRRATEVGMKTLINAGLEKVKAGTTTLDEVVRVTEIER
ncbi:MAG: type II/IV secretion system protein [Candidatus Omnitrophota bacterium]|jgi:type IV pilus assembly protein PilB|nr:MAG: type II/IV secretion system protein [Candidatus Omnitrophota bacterium]